MAHEIFISYSSRDKPIADAICANLEANGLHCWIAPRDIAPGEDWPAAISKAITKSCVMVLVFSASSNASEDVSRELMLAAKNKLVIIPFKIENIEPEPGKDYYLARTHWLDAINPPTQEQIQELVNRVEMLVPQREPAFIGPQTESRQPLRTTVQVDQSKPHVSIKSRISCWIWAVPIGVVTLSLLGWAGFSLLNDHSSSSIQKTPLPSITTPLQMTITPIQNPTPTTKLRSSPTSTPTSIPTSKPDLVPGVLYSDDFENEQSGWRQEADAVGQVQYSGGQYILSMTKGDYFAWSCAYHNFTDAVLTIDAMLVSGNADLTGPGIIWRFVDSNNFYVLRLFGNGNWRLDKQLDGEWKFLFNSTLNPPFDITQRFIKIAVSFNKETSAIYINDKYMTSFQDPSITFGDICLVAIANASSAVTVSFDNLVVYSIDSWVPPK
jgi:hypothetical protein